LREELASDWAGILRTQAAAYAQTAMANIGREFPSLIVQTMTEPGDFPFRPADRTPVFFGSLDWHSCVEMHWLLVRLLRLAGDVIPAGQVRALLDDQFDADKLATEAEFARNGGQRERPYGWAWALALVHEVASWDDHDGRRWLVALTPLAETLAAGFADWLPSATYPVRYGMHQNSAFAFSRLLPYARAHAPALASAATAAAMSWFGGDAGYLASFEPSGNEFLSPALAEAELMAQLLPAAEFAAWLERFLPGIADGGQQSLFVPAEVSDASDGQIAHLHGLNASRAWCWRRLAESLPDDDARIAPAVDAARVHLAAALPHVTGSDYMVEHWLAAYAVLALG
jgi:hypothetical protein